MNIGTSSELDSGCYNGGRGRNSDLHPASAITGGGFGIRNFDPGQLKPGNPGSTKSLSKNEQAAPGFRI